MSSLSIQKWVNYGAQPQNSLADTNTIKYQVNKITEIIVAFFEIYVVQKTSNKNLYSLYLIKKQTNNLAIKKILFYNTRDGFSKCLTLDIQNSQKHN